MTEILMAILMIAIGSTALIWGGWDVFLFCLITGIYFIYDILSEAKQLK